MTTLSSGLNTEYPSSFAAIQSRCYLANDFDAVKVWDGVSGTADDAGMAAPAAAPSAPSSGAGSVNVGIHLIRYRYYNTRSLYVSNPSPSVSVTVASAAALTFTLGTHLVASSDSKCDQIILEATTAGGTTYYRVGTLLNTGTPNIVYNVADSTLTQNDSVTALHGDFGHEQPPLFSNIVSHRGRLFGAGSTSRTRTVGVTSASTTVTGTNFSTKWAGRRIRFASETLSYEIAVATATELTLATAYSGTTDADISAVIFSSLPNRLYWSTVLYPEGWKPASYARDTLNNRSDELRGLKSFQNELWIFGRHSCERLAYTNDPGTAEGQIIPIPGDRGVLNKLCIIEAEGQLYAWDRVGMYVVGQRQEHISKPIDRTLVDYVDFAQADEFHGVYDPTDRVLMWFFTKIGDTTPHYAACLELDGARWYIAYFQQGITASHVVPDSQGQVRAMLGDENGYTWFFGIEGGYDGLPPNAPGVMTTIGTPSATVIQVSETLPTSPGLAGCVVVNTANDQTAVVASNTSSTLTMVSPGFTTAPAAAVTLHAGRIPWEYQTKWFTLPESQKHRVVYLRIQVHPSSASGKCRVYVYKNWSATPETLTKGSGESFPDGVTLGNGSVTSSTYMEVDLDGGDGDGHIMVPMPCDWSRHWKAKLVVDKPEGEIRLLDLAFTYDAAKPHAET